MQDTIADMLTRVRNAQKAQHKSVSLDSSKLKVAIATVLKDEGYIIDFEERSDQNKKTMVIYLKYFEKQPVIARIKRISKPGLRVYKSAAELTEVDGFGIAILSTSQGVMSDKAAKAKMIGGEVLCEVA